MLVQPIVGKRKLPTVSSGIYPLHLAFLLLFSAGNASGQKFTGNGSWHIPQLWNPVGVPGAGSYVQIESAVQNATANIITADAQSRYGEIGGTAGTQGTVNVNGKNWTLSDPGGSASVSVGSNGNGTLIIEQGGKVTNNYSYLGNSSAGVGSATVTGEFSLWSATRDFYIGRAGEGTLRIDSGGAVTDDNAFIGAFSGSRGDATVTGAASKWQNTTSMHVGYSGGGKLKVENNGLVVSLLGNIGSGSGGAGEVTVTGAGSQWQNSSSLRMGGGGNSQSTLLIEAGGKVATPSIDLAVSGTAIATINLNGTSSSRGVLEIGSGILENSGTGKINFDGGILRATSNQTNLINSFEAGDLELKPGGALIDTQNFTVGINAVFHGTGGLTKQGVGKLTLAGAETYSGLTTVEAGTLAVNGSLSGDVTVQSGAILSGAGTVQKVILQSGATISPGIAAFGILNTLDETWSGGGSYIWDVNSRPAIGVAGTNWDFLNVTGEMNFAATSAAPFKLDLNGNLTGLTPSTMYDWTVLSATAGFGLTFAPDKFRFDVADFTSNVGGNFSVLVSSNNLVLRYTTVPEPGISSLWMSAIGLLIGFHRHRHGRSRRHPRHGP